MQETAKFGIVFDNIMANTKLSLNIYQMEQISDSTICSQLQETNKSIEEVQRLTGEYSSNNPDTNIPHPIKLKCSSCQEYKSPDEFYISTKYPKRGREYRCKKCAKERSLAYHYENQEALLTKWKINRDNLTREQKEEIAAKNREWHKKDVRMRLLTRVKERSKRHNMVCDITIEDIVIPEKCPLLGIPFAYGSKHDRWHSYSLDRIDNSLGYVKGNVQVISYLANTMKSQASKEQLITFAKNILLLFKDDDIV